MRPRKPVLLYCERELYSSVLFYTMSTWKDVRIIHHESLDSASARLVTEPITAAVVVRGKDSEAFLMEAAMQGVPTIEIRKAKVDSYSIAHQVVNDGEMVALREALSRAIARKPGPKKQTQKASVSGRAA